MGSDKLYGGYINSVVEELYIAHLKSALYSSPEENSDSFESQIVSSSPSAVGTTIEK